MGSDVCVVKTVICKDNDEMSFSTRRESVYLVLKPSWYTVATTANVYSTNHIDVATSKRTCFTH